MAAMEKGRSKEYQIIFFTTLWHSNRIFSNKTGVNCLEVWDWKKAWHEVSSGWNRCAISAVLRNCFIAGNEKCAPQKSTKFEGTFANELSRQQLLIPHLSRWADGNMVTQTSVSGAVGSSGLIWRQFLLQVTQQKEQNICLSRHIAYECTWYAKALWFIQLYSYT